MTIQEWLRQAAMELKNAGVGSSRLDAEIILAHTLRKSRTYIQAHDNDELPLRELDIADARLQLRLDRTPIAYIIGHKEFYGRMFKVTPSTLIPRPESEAMITLLKKQLGQTSLLPQGKKLVDVGTGSGCLGITAKLELPELDITLVDISRHALTVAEHNAKKLKADVTIRESNLLTGYPIIADIILANLPYVDETWERSPETDHEPATALFAGDSGLSLIYKLIDQTETRLVRHGLLLLEADPRQHQEVVKYAKSHGLAKSGSDGFVLCFKKN